MRSTLFSLMSFLTEIFTPKFTGVKLGGYKLCNIYEYIEYMRTPCTSEDSHKWGGFLEILAASIMHSRPVHIHVMDVIPDFRICYDEAHNDRPPIMLSYEGGNHYNVLLPSHHRFSTSRPGVKELKVLTNTVLGKTIQRGMNNQNISTEQLDEALESKLELYRKAKSG